MTEGYHLKNPQHCNLRQLSFLKMLLVDAHGAFCYARSFAAFGCPYFILYLSLGLVKLNPCLIASNDVCERSIVVFRELFHKLFCDSSPSKFLFFGNEMGYPSGTYPSHF